MLEKLQISNLRNISSLKLDLSPQINFIYGENGSGKSSILEAIHYLGVGRSFRSRLITPVISYDCLKLTIFGQLEDRNKVGIEKQRDGKTQIRLNEQNLTSIAELASLLPLQLIEPHTYQILEGSPKQRRQFLDWGVFHVEPLFIHSWRNLQRVIKHRNASIRKGLSRDQITLWNHDLIKYAHEIDNIRKKYIDIFIPCMSEVVASLGGLEVSMSYYPGWNRELGLEQVLSQSLDRDIQLGYTQFGPHRADLKIKHHKISAVEVLSRGQQKVLISGMKLAQGIVLKREAGKKCLFLIDDISAELDSGVVKCIFDFLSGIKAQVIVTSLQQEVNGIADQARVFHVEHGKIEHT